ncbi:Protein 21.1 [Giardia lamblia P15]|uniref:Protein 21.1 n=1 Tax=Giardia intestinalis (strain P15) TaxID=658858 RepID=E1F2K7_GIAIA|nr:Protein 21.1 [Giardia lamblia P15]
MNVVDSPLIEAVRAEDVDQVQQNKQLAGGVDSKGNTALILAAKAGNTQIVEILAPLEARSVNTQGLTALMCAAKNGSKDIVDILVSREGKLLNKRGKTAMMYAAEAGHYDVVLALVELEKCMQNDEGKTAMMYAAEAGHDAVVATLVEYEKHMTNNRGKAAIHYAELGGHSGVMAILTEEEDLLSQGHFAASILQDSSDEGDDVVVHHLAAESSGILGTSTTSAFSSMTEREQTVRQRASIRDRSRTHSPTSVSRTRDSSIAIRDPSPSKRGSTNLSKTSFTDSAAVSFMTDAIVSTQEGQGSGIPMPYILAQPKDRSPCQKTDFTVPLDEQVEQTEVKLQPTDAVGLAKKYTDSSWNAKMLTAGTPSLNKPYSWQKETAQKYLSPLSSEVTPKKSDTTVEKPVTYIIDDPRIASSPISSVFVKHTPVAGTLPRPIVYKNVAQLHSEMQGSISAPPADDAPSLTSISVEDNISADGRSMLSHTYSQADASTREEIRKVNADIHDLIKELTMLSDQIRIKEKECEVYRAQLSRADTTKQIYSDSYQLQGTTATHTKQNAEARVLELHSLEEQINDKQREIDAMTLEMQGLEELNYALERRIIIRENELSAMRTKTKLLNEHAPQVSQDSIDEAIRNKTSTMLIAQVRGQRQEISQLQAKLQACEQEHRELQIRCTASQQTADELMKLMKQLNANASKPKGPVLPPPGVPVAIAIPCCHMIIDPKRSVKLASNPVCPKCNKVTLELLYVEDP